MRKKVLLIGIIVIIVVVILEKYTGDSGVKNDYYEVINQEVLANHSLEEGEYTWSVFTDAQEKADLEFRHVVQGILDGSEKRLGKKIQDNVRQMYKMASDEEMREKSGMKPLQEYLDGIQNSNHMDEFIDWVIRVENELGVDIFTRIVIGPDFENNQENMVYFYPVSFSFGTTVDYWVDSDYMTYKAYVKRAMIQLLEVYGYDKGVAREWVHQVVSFYEDIGKESMVADDFLDVRSYYHMVDMDTFVGVYTNLDGRDYLMRRGIGEEEIFSLVDEGQYLALNRYLCDENLELWKKVVILRILESYAEYASSAYEEVVHTLNCSLVGNCEKEKSYEDRIQDLVGSLFKTEVDYVYEQEVFSSEFQKQILMMMGDIRKHYQNMLESNVWLGRETKEYAVEKLKNMNVYLGNGKEVALVGGVYELSADSFLGNVIEIGQVQWEMELKALRENRQDVVFDQSMVNAYYNPLDNAIYIPSAIAYLFESDWSYYEKLGAIGMILAHEVTHGFDSNGSLFDQDGNLAEWWSEEDRKRYEELREQVVIYYNQYEVLHGKYIDGEATVDENIADLGALTCISGIAKERGATKDEICAMFVSFAKMWASQSSEEYTELLLLQDSHAPNKYRVNAVLSSTEMFYQAYGIYFWNDMYLSSEKRVSVW